MKYLTPVFLFLACSVFFFQDVPAQEKLLGHIDFPNSGAEEAQEDFIEGMLFLHNFEYADAARAFRRGQQIDPDFAMAYYGEAKSHNHPIWMQQNRDAAMEVLEKLGDTVEERQAEAATQREKDYLMSLEVLYGNTPETSGLSKEERDDRYLEFMKKLHEKYPDDHEITAFYGLAILGSAHEGRDYATYMKAAAELFEVWNANPKHPGAAHYLIHSFDDPVHAPLGLPMAEAYSEIAPEAAHAQHMTSHIFLALGMWDDVVDANLVARDVQTTRQKELDEKTTVCGHYPWWLQYGYLQQNNTAEAGKVLQTCTERIAQNKGNYEGMYGELWHFTIMRGHQVMDAEAWELAGTVTAPLNPESHAATNYYFTNAFAAIQSGNLGSARQNLEELTKAPESDQKTVQVKQIRGLLLFADGKQAEALTLLEEAAAHEAGLPVDFGPPTIIKPSFELLGDVHLQAGNHKKAIEAYEKQLERTPKRLLSLRGIERGKQVASK